MTTTDESYGLHIVHAHPSEGITDLQGALVRDGLSHGTLGVDVNQTNGRSSERRLALSIDGTRVSLLLDVGWAK